MGLKLGIIALVLAGLFASAAVAQIMWPGSLMNQAPQVFVGGAPVAPSELIPVLAR